MDVRSTEERPTLVIRTFTPVEKLSEVMGSSYGEIMQVMGSRGAQPAETPPEELKTEIYFPVKE